MPSPPQTTPVDDGQINPGPLTRLFTVCFVKTMNQSFVRKVWKSNSSLPSISNIYIKVKPLEHLAEAHARLFVAKKASLPVPKLYGALTLTLHAAGVVSVVLS